MNSLGIEYASSSDEEGAPTPAAPAVKAVEAPAPPAIVDKAPEPQQAEAAVTIGQEPLQTDDELEQMLQRAGIPPPVAAVETASETQQRIARFLRVQEERGQDFQTTLQDKKEVRNPYILEKVVEYFGIDELQSNFSKEVFDPHGLPLHEFSDALALEQKKRADARAQRQMQGGSRQLHFVSSDTRG